MARWRDRSWIWKTAVVVGGAIILLVAAHLSGFTGGPGLRSYSTPSASMAPTIISGDMFFAFANVYRNQAPMRRQVVVFTSPQDGKTTYVKRIIGLAGDRIQLRDGRLYINDQMAQRTRADPSDGPLPSLIVYRETLPGGGDHFIAEESDGGMLANTDPFVVPDGTVFVLGDNRDHSMDSRSFGVVPLPLLRDQPYLIYWSSKLSRIGERIE